MSNTIIRPSMRRVKWSLVLAVIIFFVIVYVYLRYREDIAWWILLAGLVPFAGPLLGWLDAHRVRLVLENGVLKHEKGLFRRESKMAAATDIAGVIVERSFTQRLWGTGTLVVETKGPQGRFVVPDVDRPNRTAELIRAAGTRPIEQPIEQNEKDTPNS